MVVAASPDGHPQQVLQHVPIVGAGKLKLTVPEGCQATKLKGEKSPGCPQRQRVRNLHPGCPKGFTSRQTTPGLLHRKQS